MQNNVAKNLINHTLLFSIDLLFSTSSLTVWKHKLWILRYVVWKSLLCKVIWKERNVLFNDALSTFYLRLYGKGPLSERGNYLPPRQGSFYKHHAIDRIAYTTACVTPVMEHWLERKIAQWVYYKGSFQWPIAPWADALPWCKVVCAGCDPSKPSASFLVPTSTPRWV